MWEIIVGIVLMVIGIGMIITAFILFFAFDLNGWYIVFISILGVALFLIGMLLWALVQNSRNNDKLRKEANKKYIIGDPNMLQDQTRQQQNKAKQLTENLGDNTQSLDDSNMGLSGALQTNSSINESGSDLLSDQSDSSNSSSRSSKQNKIDDESSFFTF